MRHGPLLCFGALWAAAISVCAPATPAQSTAKALVGTISGVVRDFSGTPQLGASVEILAETPGIGFSRQLLTNTQGLFRSENLPTGFYTIQVTLAGFLPALERHIRISPNLTTEVRVRLDSLFASIEQLRRPPANGIAEPDDWKWVLRSASGMRPVLQWREDQTDDTSVVMADLGSSPQLGQVEFTGGARRPGSVSNVGAAPGTAFAYDQRIDRSNHLVFAGQVSYDQDAPAGGLATVWLPTGLISNGPQSTVVLREAKIGPDGPTFRGVRMDQDGTLTFGDRFLLHAGGEYVLVGTGSSAWALRPRLRWEAKISSNWHMDAVYAALPTFSSSGDSSLAELTETAPPTVLAAALDQLDSFPALLWRDGRPVLENGRHEELAAERKLGPKSVLQVAAFHDDNTHVALFAKGNDLPAADYYPDFYTKGVAFDGGSSVSWGTRVALRERITDDLELTMIYAFAGSLVPDGISDEPVRDTLRTAPRHSATVKMTGKVPVTDTKLTVGYKWVNGLALSQVDPYGEAIYDVSPFLHFGIRQPLPWPTVGHWEANAECDNLLAQGYVPLNTRDGQILVVPAFRTFRGGLSLQF